MYFFRQSVRERNALCPFTDTFCQGRLISAGGLMNDPLSVHIYNVHVVQSHTKLNRHSRSTNARLKLKGFLILGERNETSSYICAAFPGVQSSLNLWKKQESRRKLHYTALGNDRAWLGATELMKLRRSTVSNANICVESQIFSWFQDSTWWEKIPKALSPEEVGNLTQVLKVFTIFPE